MSSSFDSLPNEIVDLILKETPESLNVLSQVDWRLRNLALPHLLHTITFDPTFKHFQRQLKLIGSLTDRPHYRGYVRNLVLRCSTEGWVAEPGISVPDCDDALERYRHIVEAFSKLNPDFSGHDDVTSATFVPDYVLLTFLTRLKSFTIETNDHGIRPIVNQLCYQVHHFKGSLAELQLSMPKGLHTVETVTIVGAVPEASIFAYFLPYIKEIKVNCSYIDYLRNMLPETYPSEKTLIGGSEVSRLVIEQGEDLPSISAMLHLTQHLTSFHFFAGEVVDDDEYLELIDNLYEVAGSTLTLLDLDMLCRYNDEEDNLLEKANLKRFCKLQELRFNPKEMLGASATALHIDGDDNWSSDPEEAESGQNGMDTNQTTVEVGQSHDNHAANIIKILTGGRVNDLPLRQKRDEVLNTKELRAEERELLIQFMLVVEHDELMAEICESQPGFLDKTIDSLPKSLRTLHVYQATDNNMIFLSMMLRAKVQGDLPNLATLVLESPYAAELYFKIVCQKRNVDFVYKEMEDC